MKPENAVEHVKTDPTLSTAEKEFTVGFSKRDDMAYISTSIASQVKRMLLHSDIEEDRIAVYNPEDETHTNTTVEDFDGDGIVVAFKGYVPIESLKIGSSPRNSRSYAQIISSQKSVNIEQ